MFPTLKVAWQMKSINKFHLCGLFQMLSASSGAVERNKTQQLDG